MNKRGGAKGALLDEYERAILELIRVIRNIPSEGLTYVVDNITTNSDCVSIQSILAHVISSGYSYANYIRALKKIPINEFQQTTQNTVEKYISDLHEMFLYNIETLEYFNEEDMEAFESETKMLTRWKQVYDIEQLLEHAIVHILRHRRQIENFKLLLRLN